MTYTTHNSIKSVIKESTFYQWQVAKAIGISQTTLIVWLRDEKTLDDKRKNKILEAIEELSEK
ncbi:hypothetical protein R5R51_02025 [Oenococcus oeni]|uniref:hypothetical protein n=1 Tax=Oenococcus oeni TaxID=1247 RepID=UPI000277B40E|nr:hypothetical protein [Oenococcus oeni]EJO03706.1 hypothetical protein AWRIB422_1780 [Oenococcus oeni AWRIB422]OIL93875.1 hypothetical protein ATX43_02920 [Oenococcus oeni]OIL98107.1 hypothetical protein ATX44_09620 [Oenococcus oeni]PDH84979.1 hypothetical protein AO462_03810 [Oenococcus oeni]